MDAFDSDVLIYAAAGGHILGESVRALFSDQVPGSVGIGSVLLLPEVLAKPLREADHAELAELGLAPWSAGAASGRPGDCEGGSFTRARRTDSRRLMRSIWRRLCWAALTGS